MTRWCNPMAEGGFEVLTPWLAAQVARPAIQGLGRSLGAF